MLRAFTFGQCVFNTRSARIAPDSAVHFALLLSVLLGPPNGIARDELVTRIWSRADIEDGRHCLRQAMYRLRQQGVPLRLRSGIVVLDWSEVEADVHDLLYDAPSRDELMRLGAVPFLPSYDPDLGEPFAHWLEESRARVATRLRRALAHEVAEARSSGRFDDMGQVARALLALDPLNEVGTMGLAEALALEGSKIEALKLLDNYEEEVGVVNAHLQLPARLLRKRVSEVLDDTTSPPRFEVPFIGRAGDFAAIRALFREACSGTSRAAFITGEAGVGKSRLSGEVLRLAALDGATLTTYVTSAGDSFSPLSTLVSVGQQLLTLPGALGCAQEHLSYMRRLGMPDTVAVWSLVGIAAEILYAQLVQAFAELISAIAEEAPLVIFIDDAERLHPTTWRVLVDVWDRVGTRPVLFLLAARRLPAEFGILTFRSCARLPHVVRLAPFSREESLRFLYQWSSKNQVDISDDSAQRLAALAQGNPFYLAELAAHFGRREDPEQTPPTIRELIAAQHSALSKDAQRSLLMISILESRATTARLMQALEFPAADLMAALDELEEAGLVSTKGQLVWCRHRLVGDVAISLAMPSVIAFAHSRAAAILETEADADDSSALSGDCVTHWEQAGDTGRAFRASMKLGDRLIGLGMGEEATAAYTTARGLATSDTERLGALEGSISAHRLCADWHGVLSACQERSALRRRMRCNVAGEDDFCLYAAEANMFTLGTTGEAPEFLRLAADTAIAKDFRVKAATLAAMVADNSYEPQAVNDAYSAVQSICEDDDDSADCFLCSLVFHTAVGDPSKVRALALRYADHARRSTDKRLHIHGLRRAGNALLRVGLHADAQRLLAESLEAAEKLRLSAQAFATSDVLLTCYLLNGQLSLAEIELARSRELLTRSGTEAMRIMLRYSSIMFAWLTNDNQLATRLADETTSHLQHSLAATRYCATIGEIALKLMIAPSTICREDLQSCEELFRRGGGLGRQDLNTTILCRALSSTGDVATAESIAREYRARRRELTPGPFSFPTTVAGAS